MSISDLKHKKSQLLKQPVLKKMDLSKCYKVSNAVFKNGHADIEMVVFYMGYWQDQWHGGYFELSWDGWYMYGTSFRGGVQLSNFEKLYAVVESDNTDDKV